MNKRILIIEDNLLNLKLAKRLISVAGMHTLTAYNAEDGIKLARLEKPDLILMDIQLPGINGLDATKIIKTAPETSFIPVVAVSAHAMHEEMDRAREAGCSGYITKPIDTRTFIKTLNGFLPAGRKTLEGHHKARRENLPKPVIVVADSDNENRKIIKSYLSGLGVEIVNASGERGVITSLNVFPGDIDLLILGFISPEAKRFEIARKFRADSETSEIPILAVTNSPSEAEMAWKAGVDAIVNMPVNQSELVSRVCRLVFSDMTSHPACDDGRERSRKHAGINEYILVFTGINEKNTEKILSSLPDDRKYRVLMFTGARETIDYVRSGRADILCSAAVLDDSDAVSLCRSVKSYELTSDIQIMILSKNMGLDMKIRAINAGCDDYVEMPVSLNELSARLGALLRKKITSDALNIRVEKAMNSSITDVMTGLYNYSYFRHYLDIEIKRSIRQGSPLSLLLMEINDFGRYSEKHGSVMAENIIKKTAEIITSGIRAVDFPARFSVHKFAVILPHTDGTNAETVLKRITDRIMDALKSSGSFPYISGICSGISVCPEEGIDCSSIINAANRRLLKSGI